MTIYNPDGTQALQQSFNGNAVANNSINLGGIFDASGQLGKYSVNASLYDYSAFVTASSSGQCSMTYSAGWDIFVSPGSRTVQTPTPTPVPTNTPGIMINAQINGNDDQGGMYSYNYVYVRSSDYNHNITNAVVTLKDITAVSEFNAALDGSNYYSQYPAYVPGDLYEVDVCVDGVTYTARIACRVRRR